MPQAWDNPDAFVGRVSLSAFNPYPIISSTVYSSDAPASLQFVPFLQDRDLALKNLVVGISLSPGVPGATSQASTGSLGFSYGFTANIFSRQDYSASSTNLSPYTTASGGLSASLGWSNTSQSFVMSWVTNSTGGTSSFNTTSNDAGWSAFASGPKYLSVPLVTRLPPGEYWIGFRHSSTSATSNSNVTLLSVSKLLQQWPVVAMGTLGANATNASLNPGGAGFGIASAITTNTTMAMSVISAATQQLVYFAMSNA